MTTITMWLQVQFDKAIYALTGEIPGQPMTSAQEEMWTGLNMI
jgi:hypothetical protein